MGQLKNKFVSDHKLRGVRLVVRSSWIVNTTSVRRLSNFLLWHRKEICAFDVSKTRWVLRQYFRLWASSVYVECIYMKFEFFKEFSVFHDIPAGGSIVNRIDLIFVFFIFTISIFIFYFRNPEKIELTGKTIRCVEKQKFYYTFGTKTKPVLITNPNPSTRLL